MPNPGKIEEKDIFDYNQRILKTVEREGIHSFGKMPFIVAEFFKLPNIACPQNTYFKDQTQILNIMNDISSVLLQIIKQVKYATNAYRANLVTKSKALKRMRTITIITMVMCCTTLLPGTH